MLQTSTPNTFQERLNRLFPSTHATYRYVVDSTGGIVREVYLWQLRLARVSNSHYSITLRDLCPAKHGTFAH